MQEVKDPREVEVHHTVAPCHVPNICTFDGTNDTSRFERLESVDLGSTSSAVAAIQALWLESLEIKDGK